MYKIETDSSVSSEEEKSPIKRKPPKKKTNLNNTADPLPYGRKRSCWKRSYSESIITNFFFPTSVSNKIIMQLISGEGEKLGKSVPEAGVITCAICGIQRYYKFIKQTKKFGLHSCEPCRKFISAMIANVRNGTQFSFSCVRKGICSMFLKCLFRKYIKMLYIIAGPENCMLLERLSVQNGVKTKRDCLSNIRCKACWLALCLQKYEMHPGLRNSLAQFIAEDDRPSFSTSNTENEFSDMGTLLYISLLISDERNGARFHYF